MNELHYQVDLLRAINRKQMERERMYLKVCQVAVGAFLYVSFERGQITTLGQWSEYFPFEIKEFRDLELLLDAVDESCLLQMGDVIYPEKSGRETADMECLLRDGRTWMQFRTRVYYNEKGKPDEKVIYISDITKLHAQKDELTYMAYYDSLTGLYNRNYFVRLLGEYLKRASETGCIVSVVVINIDEFRKVNDSMGLVVGDELVRQFGAFLKELCREDIIACHLHSDVYCMAIYDPAGNKSVSFLHRSIQERIRAPFYLKEGKDVSITVSMGVAEYPEASDAALELINCAEIVVFKGKAYGAGTLHYFDAPVMDELLHSIELENKLKKAVYSKDFVIHYQPQYYAGNRRLRGVEALVRWKGDGGELIGPTTFIPVAENNGSIVPIGRWVMEESIRQYAVWKQQFGFPFIMSVNISALQYKREDFVDSVMEVLDRYQVKPAELELEITESVLIEDFRSVAEKLRLLREQGVKISLDDFGTGFSSLAYLKRLPVDTLKVDKSFIDTVLTDSSTRVITESIINMVKSLGFEAIAEGVEEEQQYRYLHAIGCDVIQGYLFGQPLPPEEMESVFSDLLQ